MILHKKRAANAALFLYVLLIIVMEQKWLLYSQCHLLALCLVVP